MNAPKKRITEMSPEEKRIAIAEACGWRRQREMWPTGERITWLSPIRQPGDIGQSMPPDFLNDLNEINEAVLSLEMDDHTSFCLHVCDICKREKAYPILASAALRSEALLLTLGHEN